jgi:hypothetical protein
MLVFKDSEGFLKLIMLDDGKIIKVEDLTKEDIEKYGIRKSELREIKDESA